MHFQTIMNQECLDGFGCTFCFGSVNHSTSRQRPSQLADPSQNSFGFRGSVLPTDRAVFPVPRRDHARPSLSQALSKYLHTSSGFLLCDQQDI